MLRITLFLILIALFAATFGLGKFTGIALQGAELFLVAAIVFTFLGLLLSIHIVRDS
jgi:hypothetical protein